MKKWKPKTSKWLKPELRIFWTRLRSNCTSVEPLFIQVDSLAITGNAFSALSET